MSTLQAAPQIEELVNHQKPESISLVMPTYSAGRRVTQNAIRFKNLVREAIDQLQAISDCSEREAEKKLSALMEREHDDTFWQNQSAGLAVYFCNGEVQWIELNESPERLVYVSDHFYITPVAVQLAENKRRNVLTVSWDSAAFWESTQTQIEMLDCEQFPVNFRDIVLPPDPEEQLQFHTQRGGDANVMYHGQGEGEESIEADRQRYLSEIAKRVKDLLGTGQDQLIVVATTEVAGHLAAAGCRPELSISASPADLNQHELHERVRQAVKQEHGEEDSKQNQLREDLGTAIAQNKGSRDPLEIISAAITGRVSHLMVDPQTRLWGKRSSDGLSIDEIDDDGKCEAVNLAILHALRTGAEVSVCSEESPLAAIFRY